MPYIFEGSLMTKLNATPSLRRAAGLRLMSWMRLLILGGAIAALPLGAQPLRSEPLQPLWGVWKGTAGDVDVFLCVQADPDRSPSDTFAALYTTADYQIELLDRSDETGETWGARLDETLTASLSVLADGSVLLERNPGDAWSGVPLAPIPFSVGGDQARPCESAAFNRPRAVPLIIERTADRVDGHPYEILTLVDPAGHGEVSTFQLPSGPEGYDVINTWLSQAIPETAEEAPYYTCTVDALAWGAGSFWEQRFRPDMISDRFVVIAETSDVFCGGPYPDQSTEWYVFDSQTGKEIDTHTWFHPDAFNLLGPNAGAGPEIGDPDIEIGFRDLLTRVFLSTGPDESCLDLLDDVEVWNIRPTKAGFTMSPEVAHGAQFCAKDLTIDDLDMQPYLGDGFPKP
jgi:hypothetical protein